MNPLEREEGAGPSESKARLASIIRTWNWLGARAERAKQHPFVGASCAGMLESVWSNLPEDAPEKPGLMELGRRFLDFDALDESVKSKEVEAICEALETYLSPGLFGLRPPPVSPAGELVVPSRRRRRKSAKDEPRASSEEDGAVEVSADRDESTASSESEAGVPDASSADVAGTEVDAEEVDPAEVEFRRLLAEAQDSSNTQSKKPERQTQRLPFGHSEGTGRSVGDLAVLDEGQRSSLEAAGIRTVSDLLMRAPLNYARPEHYDTSSAEPSSDAVILRGIVRRKFSRWSPVGRRDEITLEIDGGTRVHCRWLLMRPRGFPAWVPGSELALIGHPRTDEEEGVLLLESEPVGLDGRGSGSLPEYGIEGLDERIMRRAISEAIGTNRDGLRDWMPRSIQNKERLINFDAALREAHFPGNSSGRGRERLAFDEVFLLQLGVAWKAKKGSGGARKGVSHRLKHERLGLLANTANLVLDDSQESALDEIRRDLIRSAPMQRLIQGDVGAGKGLIALFGVVLTARSESQVAMIHDDASAAERAYVHAEPLLRSLGISSSVVGEKPDRGHLDAIRRGETHVVYGTKALVGEGVEWRRLSLVVSREDETVGTVMPADLAGFDRRPDLLIVTRSPLPLRLVLTLYSGFELTMVDSQGGAGVRTQVLGSDERQEGYARAAARLAEGGQVFVVFPVRDGKDLLSLNDAKRMAEALRSEAFPDAAIGVYSSAMSRDERQRVFDDFQHRRVDVLVSTTYIEDAPEVPNASTMMVEYADLHSIERLHRLRGHVNGARDGGRCFFIESDKPDEDMALNLGQLLAERDGIRLAELDLDNREGDRVATAENRDLPVFRWMNPETSRQVVFRAREQAFQVLNKDPELKSNTDVARMLNQRWGEWMGEKVAVGKPNKGSSRRRNRRRRRR